jgi:hypothetical protein
MGLIAGIVKVFLLSSGTRSLKDDPSLEDVRVRRHEYDRMDGQLILGDLLKRDLALERLTFLQTHRFDRCPLYDAYVEWTDEDWETYRRTHPVPPRSLR